MDAEAGKPEDVHVEPSNLDKIKTVLSLMEQGKSERSACESAGISRSTFRTTALRAQVGDQYARSLESLGLEQVEKLEQALDDMRSGIIDAQMARVEIDARKWFASKFLPKQFGDKIQHVGGGPEDAPISHSVAVRFVGND